MNPRGALKVLPHSARESFERLYRYIADLDSGRYLGASSRRQMNHDVVVSLVQRLDRDLAEIAPEVREELLWNAKLRAARETKQFYKKEFRKLERNAPMFSIAKEAPFTSLELPKASGVCR